MLLEPNLNQQKALEDRLLTRITEKLDEASKEKEGLDKEKPNKESALEVRLSQIEEKLKHMAAGGQ